MKYVATGLNCDGPPRRIAKARESLAFAHYSLAGGFTDAAGRAAYMAGFHAALAFIEERINKSPKTHSGARSEFARLARDEPRIGRDQVSFLGWSYELKTIADYDQQRTISTSEAQYAIDEATLFIEVIAGLIANIG